MKKRALSFVLAALMLVTLATAALAGTTELSIQTPNKLPKAGETFTVTVSISGNPGLSAAKFTLGYDKAVMQCNSVSLGSLLSGTVAATNPNGSAGAIVGAASTAAKTGDGVLATYSFTAGKNLSAWNFTLLSVKLLDANGQKIAVANVAPIDEPASKPVIPTEEENPAQEVVTTPVSSFPDLVGHWSETYVKRAVELKLFSGYPDGGFHPDVNISRADFVVVLWRSAGSPEPKQAAQFADVSANSYYAKAVSWAKENGYVDGVSATAFDPTGSLQRQAAMKILYSYNGGASGIESLLFSSYDATFTDSSSIASWAKDAMYWAYANGIISGVGENALAPTLSASRAQLAKILVNYLDKNSNIGG